jgi:membrane protease YdiL (CAAX protease family)
LTGGLSVAALLIWANWTDSLGIGTQLMQGITSQYPMWLILIIGIPFFALVNAFAEEVVYRGVLQGALMQVFPQMPVVLVLQTSAFAAFHFAIGFPNGWVGYGMVFVWGLMLGYLRIRTSGMLVPYIAHVIADVTIGCYLYLSVS